MANSDEIVSWLTTIHGDTTLISSEYRPVPLRYYFADNLGARHRTLQTTHATLLTVLIWPLALLLQVLSMFTNETAGPGGRADAPLTVQKRDSSE